jgi:hypothetical protein
LRPGVAVDEPELLLTPILPHARKQ